MNKRGQESICNTDENFEYDSKLDILYIYTNIEEEVYGSIPFGDLIFDISVSGKLIGLEIDNASLFFKVEPKKILNIQSAKVNVIITKNMLSLTFNVIFENNNIYNFEYAIPKNKICITN